MDSVDFTVLQTVMRWQAAAHRVALVTVVATWGSSPRPPGAMLAIRDDGHVSGSVSGGCIEDDLSEAVRRNALWQGHPFELKYGVSADHAHRFGLPCGGTIRLVVEPLGDHSGIDRLYDAVCEGKLVTRSVDMETGQATIAPASSGDGLRFDGKRLISVHGPRYRLLVIGAGQLSEYLCQVAKGLDYDITVCDPREEYTQEWTVPGVKIVRSMPDDTVVDMKLDERSAVLAVTHDPKLDDLALMEALRSPAFYVGALGSRRNNDARRKRLLEFDLTEAQIQRLRGPVGIYIGSRTPPEIALSALAEITAIKNGVTLPEKASVGTAKTLTAQSADADSGCAVPR